jgi:hypothetical protein
MHALEIIAERRIEEAVARGELQGLPGEGRPLDLDDEDPLMPYELRMAKRILKNADLSPVDILKEMRYEGVARSALVAGTEYAASGYVGRDRSQSANFFFSASKTSGRRRA